MSGRRRTLLGFLGVLLVGVVLASAWSLRTQDAAPPAAPARAAKLLVTSEGMYEVTAADLAAAGSDWESVDPSRIRLSNRGRELPLSVAGSGEDLRLRFYGQPTDSRYTAENAYWLEPAGEAGGLRIEEPEDVGQGTAGAPTDRYSATARAEENAQYAPRAEEVGPWFWVMLAAPRSHTFEITLTEIADAGKDAPQLARLRMGVWASTEAPASPDHHLRVTLNGQPVADATWDGAGAHTIEADLPLAVLQEGVNAVEVDAPGDTEAAADISYVDWIEIVYPRALVAEDDRLAFDGADAPQRLSGFTGPVAVFDVSDPRAVAQVAQLEAAASEGAVFQGEPGHRYLAVGPEGFLAPDRIAPARMMPDLRAAATGADYVAIGPPELLEPLGPLLAWRADQALETLSVPLQAVYDQFNHGLAEPQAIRQFLKHASEAWEPAPEYVLLVGDASYDPRGYTAPAEANQTPSLLIYTEYGGETASDVVLADVDEDGWPDLALGRIPARTPEQAATAVRKVLAYEGDGVEGDWRRRIMAVADGREPVFRRDAETFVERFPPDYTAVEVYPEGGAEDAVDLVRRELNTGNLVVAYFGHGSLNQWGRDRLFTTADTADLDNGDRLSIMVNMTCLTGLFTHPTTNSLAESLLWHPDGGAVAVLAPTSLTLPGNQSFLSSALVTELLEERAPTLGQAVLAAQWEVPLDSSGAKDVLNTFLLFGDPALRVAYPNNE